MKWLLLALALAGCDHRTSTTCLQDVCYATCRAADSAWQNDADKNAACAKCVRECAGHF